MILDLIGTWVSNKSDIPDYIPGKDWLHFTTNDSHVWELFESNERQLKIRFVLKDKKNGLFQFSPLNGATQKAKKEGWEILLEKITDEEIAITSKGFTTFYIKK